MSEEHNNYHTKSAVLFIIFNRVDTALAVLSEISKARPQKMYVAADGPRLGRTGETLACEETRNLVLNNIDWDCEVYTLFREDNIGPKEAISSAISWLFDHEEEGIVLEHDCLPNNSFFYFCDTMLQKYRTDSRIWLISGFNFNSKKKRNEASYYFSNLTNGWGWATWKRSWATYDKDLSKYELHEVRAQLEKIFMHQLIIDRWVEIFEDTKNGKIDTWDYQVTFAHLFNHALTIIPNYNLVSNIGFGEFAENTKDVNSPFANVPLQQLKEIIHPKYMVPEKLADEETLIAEFGIVEKLAQLKKHNAPKRRFKRWLKNVFKLKGR